MSETSKLLTAGEIAAHFDVAPATISKAIRKAETALGTTLGQIDPEDRRFKLFTPEEINMLEPFVLKGNSKVSAKATTQVLQAGELIPAIPMEVEIVDADLLFDTAAANRAIAFENFTKKLENQMNTYINAAFLAGAQTQHKAQQAFYDGLTRGSTND